MNKQQIARALADGIEVAVFTHPTVPKDVFQYANDRERVARARVLAVGERYAVLPRWSNRHELSSKAEGVRVLPLDPPTKSMPLPWRSATRPAVVAADGTVTPDEASTEQVVTSRYVLMTWPEFEQRLAARTDQEAREKARRQQNAKDFEQNKAQAGRQIERLKALGITAQARQAGGGYRADADMRIEFTVADLEKLLARAEGSQA